MARVTANSFIGGGLSDAVYVAPKGTTFPTTLAAPSGTFVEVGWLGEGGMGARRTSTARNSRATRAGRSCAAR